MKKALIVMSAIFTMQIATARADFSVDISSQVNSDAQTYTNGNNYPLGGSILNFGGVSFTLANGPLDNPNGTGTILATAPGQVFDISNLAITNAGVAYVLINSGFGSAGADIGTLEFVGTGGLDYKIDLVEGVNVRDHFQGGFNNSASDIYHTFAFNGGVRFDEYKFVLPTAFSSETLTNIILSSTNSTGGLGEPLIAAITITGPQSAVPEPSSLALLGLGGLGLAIGAYRRRKAIV